MDTIAKPLRTCDEELLRALWLTLNAKGREAACKRHGVRKLTELRGKWEGYHLLDYAESIRVRAGYEKVQKALQDRGISEGFVALQRLPSEKTISLNRLKTLFESLANAQGKSLVLCLVEFLEFCRDNNLRLSLFEDNKPDHEGTIEDIRRYLEAPCDSALTKTSPALSDAGAPRGERPSLSIHWVEGTSGKHDRCKIALAQSGEPLDIPVDRSGLNLANVFSLLKWQHHLCKIVGREDELDRLNRWLTSEARISIQLLHGEGGAGKSRLAFTFAQKVAEEGWEAGSPDRLIEGNWRIGPKGTLLILDYPEERAERVGQLARALSETPVFRAPPGNGLRLRVLLISRNRDFLERLTAPARHLLTTAPIDLSGLDTDESQRNLIIQAWETLQELKIREGDGSDVAPLPIDPEHVAAWLRDQSLPATPLILLSVVIYYFREDGEGLAPEVQLQDLTLPTIFRALTLREAARIKDEVEYGRNANPRCHNLSFPGVMITKAMASIADGLDEHALATLGEDIAPHEKRYPPPDVDALKELSFIENRRLPPVQPDILAADFLAYCLEEWPLLSLADWLFSVTGLTRCQEAGQKTHERVAGNFSRLGRLIYDVRIRLERKEFLPVVVLRQSLEDRPLYAEWIAENLSRSYLEPELFPLVLEAVKLRLTRSLDRDTQANTWRELSALYGAIGDTTGALAAARRAVEIREELAKGSLSVHGLDLARSLNNLSIALSTTGDHEGALAAIQRAVDIAEMLAEKNFPVHGNDLARILHSRANALGAIGDIESALAAIERAVAIREKLAERNFSAYGPDLARSLSNLCVFLGSADDNNGALEASRRAVEVQERLAKERLSVHGPALTGSLNNLSISLFKSGDSEGALATVRRAVEIGETFAKQNLPVHGPHLAESLNNLAIYLGAAGENAGAVAAGRRAVEITERLAEDNFTAYASDYGHILLFYCTYFELDTTFLLRAKEIYLQVFETCSDAWVLNFSDTLGDLLCEAIESGNTDAVQVIEAIGNEIGNLPGA